MASQPSSPAAADPDRRADGGRADWTDQGKCLACGYALRGLTGAADDPRCPECGRSFRPDAPQTMELPGDRDALGFLRRDSRLRPGFGRSVILSSLLAAAYAALPAWLSWWDTGKWEGSGYVLLVGGTFGWAAVGWTIVRRALRYRRAASSGHPRLLHRRRAMWPWAVAAIAVVGMPASTVYWRCPHGVYVSFGVVRLALREDVNGPCGNPRGWVPLLQVPWADLP